MPLVITTHGLIGQTAPHWFSNLYLSSIGKFTLKSADKIISYTESEKNYLINMGIDEKKIRVIHNGIDTELFIPMEKQDTNIIRILWIGRFVPGKGVEYLIDAFNILVKEYPNLEILMVGNGPLKEKVKHKIYKLNLNKNIILKEFVPNIKLPELYQNSDIFVLPSLSEGVPRTMLEAMACGLPIVCTELPQLVDIVKECGVLVPLKDFRALAEGISKVISDRKLAQKFGRNARTKMVENYSWDDSVRKTIELYMELIN